VLRRWVDPPGALKLVDLAEPLHPRGVNEVLLRFSAAEGFGVVNEM